MNILDLKILQVFFKNRGEILVFEKMLNFLSFLVLLYVSGHSKQKKNFKIFLKNLQVFFKTRGKILFLKKMLNSSSFLVLLCVSGNFKQKIFFQNFSD